MFGFNGGQPEIMVGLLDGPVATNHPDLESEVKLAVTQASAQRRTSVLPPLLDAWVAYQRLLATYKRRNTK